MELKLTRAIHHVESECNYFTTFSVMYPNTEFRQLFLSCLIAILSYLVAI